VTVDTDGYVLCGGGIAKVLVCSGIQPNFLVCRIMNTATIPFFTAVEPDSLIAVLWHISCFSN